MAALTLLLGWLLTPLVVATLQMDPTEGGRGTAGRAASDAERDEQQGSRQRRE